MLQQDSFRRVGLLSPVEARLDDMETPRTASVNATTVHRCGGLDIASVVFRKYRGWTAPHSIDEHI